MRITTLILLIAFKATSQPFKQSIEVYNTSGYVWSAQPIKRGLAAGGVTSAIGIKFNTHSYHYFSFEAGSGFWQYQDLNYKYNHCTLLFSLVWRNEDNEWHDFHVGFGLGASVMDAKDMFTAAAGSARLSIISTPSDRWSVSLDGSLHYFTNPSTKPFQRQSNDSFRVATVTLSINYKIELK